MGKNLPIFHKKSTPILFLDIDIFEILRYNKKES